MKKLIQNGKHLIFTDTWFVGPDGEFYNAAFGDVEICNDEDALGIKTNARSSNWFAKVGTENSYVIIAGCQIHYAVRCDGVNEEALKHRPKKEGDDWTKARIWKAKENTMQGIFKTISDQFVKDMEISRRAISKAFPPGGFMTQLPYNEVPEILKEINEKGVKLSAELRQDSQLTDATHYYGLGILENFINRIDDKEFKIGVDAAKPGRDKTATRFVSGKVKGRSVGLELIAQEREKQIGKYGYTARHSVEVAPDWYDNEQLMSAAISMLRFGDSGFVPEYWDRDKFTELKSRSIVERLQIAGAFIAAELDRLHYKNHGEDWSVVPKSETVADIDLGTIKFDIGDIDTRLEGINKVLEEMNRQDKKFGADRNLPPGDWISILTEEVGEVAKEWNDAGLDLTVLKPFSKNYETELVQVAAVALQAIKNIKKY